MYEAGTQVRYHGSIESLHGETFTIVGSHGDRYRLSGVRTLVNVRQASITPIEGPELRTDLERAIAGERPVMITYVAADGEWTTRTIEPYELAATSAGHLIVRAMDHRSREPRTFRVDRIHAVNLLPGSFWLERPAPDQARAERAALVRLRAEIAQIAPSGYGNDAARWTPGTPIL